MTGIPRENHQEKENRLLQCNLCVSYVHSSPPNIYVISTEKWTYLDALAKFSGKNFQSRTNVGLIKFVSFVLQGKFHHLGWKKNFLGGFDKEIAGLNTGPKYTHFIRRNAQILNISSEHHQPLMKICVKGAFENQASIILKASIKHQSTEKG